VSEFVWNLGADGVEITSEVDKAFHFPLSQQSLSGQPSQLLHSLTVLEDLWSEGLAEQKGPNYWCIPFESIHDLSPEQLTILGLPTPTPLRISVRVLGIPGSSPIELAIEVHDFEGSRFEGVVGRSGPFYLPADESGPILITNSLYLLFRLGSEYRGEGDQQETLAFLGNVKRLARRAGAHLEGILEREEYYFPEGVRVNLKEARPDHLELKPELAGDGIPSISPQDLISKSNRRVHSVVEKGGKRQRIVLTQKVRDAVQGISRNQSITGQNVPRFLENPEGFLPEGIDLEDFSERVKGLKTVVYNSRPYLHLHQKSVGWFEGIPGIRLDPIIGGGQKGQKPPDLSTADYEDLVRRAEETGDEYVQVEDGWLKVDADRGRSFLDKIQSLEPQDEGRVLLPTRGVLDIYENLEDLEFELPPLQDLGLQIEWEELPTTPVPSSFQGELKPYQLLGFHWIAHLDQTGTGGLLADEMGLGKTVQVIAHMARLSEENRLSPCLIVAPKTILENWAREIIRFAPSCGNVVLVERSRVVAEALAECDIAIMSYDTLRRHQLEIAKVDWQLVVSDEAQYAKNPTAQRTSALKALKARHRLALTGTPVENGLIEFWCIMDFVRPGLLSSWQEFRTEYERPLSEVSSTDERLPLVTSLLDRLHPHYLRRLKDTVLPELPQKQEVLLEAHLTSEQIELYQSIASRALSGGRGSALSALNQLLIACGHPQALETSGEDFVYVHGECPKLDRTLEELKKIKEKGEKAVIFTRFIAVQNILRGAIHQTLAVRPSIINGQLTSNRQLVVDAFCKKAGFNVLILSHDVGGVGLNIVEANHVFHYTRPWNPAKENQATDRVHRIGQEKEVFIYLPTVTHEEFTTVEEKLAELLKRKSSLARDVLRPTKDLQIVPDELMEVLKESTDQPDDVLVVSEEKSRFHGEDFASPTVVESIEHPQGVVEEESEVTAQPDVVPREPSLREEDPLDSERSPVVTMITLSQRQVGISFDRLFRPYLKGATTVELADPFLRLHYQFRNLQEFASVVAFVRTVKKLKVITSIKEPEEKDFVTSQLEALKTRLNRFGVEVEYRLDPTLHDRWIETDNGWTLTLGRGLDMFLPPPYGRPPPQETERECRATRIGCIQSVGHS
jgi:superfamily II DNA or RNA helicase